MRMYNGFLAKTYPQRCPDQDPVSCHLATWQLEISAILCKINKLNQTNESQMENTILDNYF